MDVRADNVMALIAEFVLTDDLPKPWPIRFDDERIDAYVRHVAEEPDLPFTAEQVRAALEELRRRPASPSEWGN